MVIRETILISLCSVAGATYAQSSVTLYGIVDTAIVYQNSQTALGSMRGGHSVIKMASGLAYGDRLGLKGVEDLGGGTRAIFTLESGFTLGTGAAQFTDAIFGRQAFVGLSNPKSGTLTAGRQYSAYYTLLMPYSSEIWLRGSFGAHPGDVDALDQPTRVNNSLVYQSPEIHGLRFAGSYAVGGVPGRFNSGSTWSVATSYAAGPVGIAIGILRINNSTPGGGVFGTASTASGGGQIGVSAVTNGYATAQAQQRIAVTGRHIFNPILDLSLSYSNVQYIPGANSAFRDTAVWNTAGAVLHYRASSRWDFAVGYSYTRSTRANGITAAAQYQQINLAEYYTLSKWTGIYALQGYQRAYGQTLGSRGAGNFIAATSALGDGFQSTPSSSSSMLAIGIGIYQQF
ncbi:porin [Burkholderia cenocepacia]|uniref:porin n=1 Tax=Burkholderia cenocepacia TaxID=95486 RepID=UPI001907AABC|nr:porin [Burkholderia cenocepacia]MBJ9698685.1 porin [Burkholderia cenocepacia]